MKSAAKIYFFLQNVIICLCLITSAYAAVPFNSGRQQSASYNRNQASAPASQLSRTDTSRTRNENRNNNFTPNNKRGPLGMRQPFSNSRPNNSPANNRKNPPLPSDNAGILTPGNRSLPPQRPGPSVNKLPENSPQFKRTGPSQTRLDVNSSRNTTLPTHSGGIKPPFNNAPKFSKPGRADVIPVVLKQSNVNANNRSKPNITVPNVHNGRNASSFNNTTTISKSGRADVIPVVLKQSNVNANNRSRMNVTGPIHNSRNVSSFNNTMTFSKPGKSDVLPAVVKQYNINANNRPKTEIARAFPTWTAANAPFNETDFGRINSSNNDKSVSSMMKTILKELKKLGKNSYTIDYGNPIVNKGSDLKLFGGKIMNSLTGCCISAAVVYAAIYRRACRMQL